MAPAVGELADVVGDQALHGLGGARPAEPDLAHVRDVEEAGGRAHGLVLVEDAGRDTAPAWPSRRSR